MLRVGKFCGRPFLVGRRKLVVDAIDTGRFPGMVFNICSSFVSLVDVQENCVYTSSLQVAQRPDFCAVAGTFSIYRWSSSDRIPVQPFDTQGDCCCKSSCSRAAASAPKLRSQPRHAMQVHYDSSQTEYCLAGAVRPRNVAVCATKRSCSTQQPSRSCGHIALATCTLRK